MNNKRIVDLLSVPDLSVGGISSFPTNAVNVATMTGWTGAMVALNTPYCGPLSSDMDVKDKRVVNMGDASLVTVGDPLGEQKVKQGMNYGTVNSLCLTTAPEDRSNFYANNKRIFEL